MFNGHVWTHTEATGVTTGAKYVGNLVSTSMIIQTIDGGLFVTTNPANIHLTQQGEGLPGDDLFLHALLHVVLLDGQAPVVNIDFRTECR